MSKSMFSGAALPILWPCFSVCVCVGGGVSKCKKNYPWWLRSVCWASQSNRRFHCPLEEAVHPSKESLARTKMCRLILSLRWAHVRMQISHVVVYLYILSFLADILGRPGLHDEGLQVTILGTQGASVNVPIWRTAHCFHVIPANDMKDWLTDWLTGWSVFKRNLATESDRGSAMTRRKARSDTGIPLPTPRIDPGTSKSRGQWVHQWATTLSVCQLDMKRSLYTAFNPCPAEPGYTLLLQTV